MDKLDMAIQILKNNNQDEVANQLENLRTLDIDKKEEKISNLYESILSIDFKQLLELYSMTKSQIKKEKRQIEEIKYIDKNKITLEKQKEYEKKALNNLKHYAVITMAGRQGTRLGYNGPKRTFQINVFGKKKTLFEILAKNIIDINKKYNVNIPWYIMTSNENHEMTKKYFQKNNYFGLDITLFKQNDLPLLDNDGNILINSNFEVKRASDGNGGVFQSLRAASIISQMKEKDIKYLFVSGVDNCLAKLVDLEFLGLFIDGNYKIGSKSVIKLDPHERVGVFCKENGRPKVIEYSELSKQMAEKKNQDGTLVFSQSNILCHMFSIDAIEEISNKTLIYHYAKKKNSYLNNVFTEVSPSDNNCFKFESFIFDSFELFDDMLIFMVNRDDEFAPIKNKEGNDSPKTAKMLYENFLKRHKLN